MEMWELVAREQVRHTVSAYNLGGDRGRLDELAEAFAPDGSLHIGLDPPIVGRDSIRARLGEMIAPDPTPRFVHHHVAGLHFRTVSRELIETTSYFQVLTDGGLDHWGRYRDRFVPVDARWLIAERHIRTEAFAPDSYFSR